MDASPGIADKASRPHPGLALQDADRFDAGASADFATKAGHDSED
jgi:hypothetical protein